MMKFHMQAITLSDFDLRVTGNGNWYTYACDLSE